MVCSSAIPSKSVFTANNILLMRNSNHALVVALVWNKLFNWEGNQLISASSARLPLPPKNWKQTRWSNDKTIIELSYRKISWFVSVSQINYWPQPLASAIDMFAPENHDVLLEGAWVACEHVTRFRKQWHHLLPEPIRFLYFWNKVEVRSHCKSQKKGMSAPKPVTWP